MIMSQHTVCHFNALMWCSWTALLRLTPAKMHDLHVLHRA